MPKATHWLLSTNGIDGATACGRLVRPLGQPPRFHMCFLRWKEYSWIPTTISNSDPPTCLICQQVIAKSPHMTTDTQYRPMNNV